MLVRSLVILLLLGTITGCSEKTNHEHNPLEKEQFARVQILNAFSATDSAIRAVAHNNQLIESILDDRGGSSGGGDVERMRGWSIHLKSDADQQGRAKLLEFLKALGSSYEDLNRLKYGDVPDFDYSYEVVDHGERIDVTATGSFGTP
jgi:hypothetical protein